MLKPIEANLNVEIVTQPPSGGCVLKLYLSANYTHKSSQPPSGGCVLKQYAHSVGTKKKTQPPSGGCVLKQ